MRLAMTPAASSDPHVKQRELETYARRLAARCAPELCGNVALIESRGRREGRELAAPMAPVRMKCTGQEPQVRPRHPGLPCATVLTLIRALLGDRLSCPHVATTRDARCARHQLRDARTTRFRVRSPAVRPRAFVAPDLDRKTASHFSGSCAPAAACPRPSHSVANVRDDRDTSLSGTERAEDRTDLGEAPSDLCFSEGLDGVGEGQGGLPDGRPLANGSGLSPCQTLLRSLRPASFIPAVPFLFLRFLFARLAGFLPRMRETALRRLSHAAGVLS